MPLARLLAPLAHPVVAVLTLAAAALGLGCGSSTEPAVVAISIESGTATISTIGGTLQLSARVVGKYGPLDKASVTWSSDSTLIATVSNSGLVTAHQKGSATITARSAEQTATIRVSVAPAGAPVDLRLTVSAAGTGGTGTGQVTSTPSGIDCTLTDSTSSGSCSASFSPGQTVRLTETQTGLHAFNGWLGCSGTTTCDIAINADTTVRASFTAPITVVAAANPTTGGSVTDAGTFAFNSAVTIHAVPSSGYTFRNWVENGTAVSTSAAYSFNATANRNLIANFTPVFVTTQAVPSASGNVGALMAPLTAVTATGGIPPYAWSVSPALPSGLTLNAATGEITGTPLAELTQTTFTITTTDAGSSTSSKTFLLTVLPSINSLTAVAKTLLAPVVQSSAPLPSYPSVRVMTGGTAVAGVPVTFTVTAVAGRCTLSQPATVNSDATGLASLSSATFSMTRASGGSCRVHAQAGALSDDILVVAQPSGTNVWIGGTSTAWSTATNWSSGTAPSTASNTVFVPGYAPRQPKLSAATVVGSTMLEESAPATIDLAGFPLTIGGDFIAFHNVASIVSSVAGGSVTLSGAGFPSVSGKIVAPVTIAAGTSYMVPTAPNGATDGAFSTGNLTINGSVSLSAVTRIDVDTSLVVATSGALNMTSANTLVTTTGDITFNSTSTGVPTNETNGTLMVGRNMIIGISGLYKAQGSNEVVFGPGAHELTVLTGTLPIFAKLRTTGALTANAPIIADSIGVSAPGAIATSVILTGTAAGDGSYAGVNLLRITGGSCPSFTGTSPVEMSLQGACSFSTDMSLIGTNVTILAPVDFQGHAFSTTGTLTVDAAAPLGARMLNIGDVKVGGDLLFAGQGLSLQPFTLATPGWVEVGGNLTFETATRPLNVNGMTVRMMGQGSHTIAYGNSSHNTDNLFYNLLVTADVTLSGVSSLIGHDIDVLVAGVLRIPAGSVVTTQSPGTLRLYSGSSLSLGAAGVYSGPCVMDSSVPSTVMLIGPNQTVNDNFKAACTKQSLP
jgi:hypothetical protein